MFATSLSSEKIHRVGVIPSQRSVHICCKNQSRRKCNALVPFPVSSNDLYDMNIVIPLLTTQTQITD